LKAEYSTGTESIKAVVDSKGVLCMSSEIYIKYVYFITKARNEDDIK